MAEKVGAVVLATEQGLGYLAKDFYDHGIINRVFIQPHSSRKNHPEWYKDEDRLIAIDDLLTCDTILFFETPFDWKLIPKAREKGVKTILMVMYECTPYPLFYQPDIILSPSSLDKQYYPQSIQVQVPVTQNWRMRKRARTFVHNSGHGGLGGRNGTKQVIEAMKYVKSPIRLLLRSQDSIYAPHDERISVEIGTIPSSRLYDGDVFLFPEKFNGLSLPLQEAFASGMAIMAGDRFPINEWLPREILIPVSRYTKERISCEFDCAHYDPKNIAMKIDEWYNKPIESLSLLGKEWAEKNSWDKLKQHYLDLCATNR